MDPMLSYPRLATTGEVFYQLYGNDVIEKRLGDEQLVVPQRDVLHIRLHTVRHRFPRPLVGELPLVAAYADVGVGAPSRAQQYAVLHERGAAVARCCRPTCSSTRIKCRRCATAGTNRPRACIRAARRS